MSATLFILLGLRLLVVGGQPPEDSEKQPAQETQAAESPAAEVEEAIDVIAITPLAGGGLDPDRLPWTVSRIGLEELETSLSGSVTASAERSLPGVHLSAPQGNPLQPDLFVRGFSGSPLLGSSQGLSLWVDGVRVNEVFGDVAQWDVLPRLATEELTLAVGPWASFGPNTLGGALSLRTKNGFDHDRSRVLAAAGSWGRRVLGVEHGSAWESWALYASGELFDEDGWRDHSPTRSRLAHLKLSRRATRGAWDLSLDGADNELVGNGTAPVQLLEIDRLAVFTYPDITDSTVVFPRWRVQRQLSERVHLEGVLFYRDSDLETFNADDLELDELDELGYDAADNRSSTDQRALGGSVEIALGSSHGDRDGAVRDNLLIVGVAWDDGRAGFAATTELATLTDDRATVGSGIFVPGARVGVDAEVERRALFATDDLRLSDRVSLTAQARWQEERVRLRDRIGSDLDGDHRFRRLNVGLGASVVLRDQGSPSLIAFAGVAQSNRIPTPVELTCADPEDPCRLPNAFVADPPLEQVVTTGWDVGLRGRYHSWRWDFSGFGSRSVDDILFISSGRLSNAGHFTNVEATSRRGIELSMRGRQGRLSWFASYTDLEATFEDDFRVQSVNHPLAADGEILVRRGDRIPGIPSSLLKAGFDLGLGDRFSVNGIVRSNSSRVLRGDEANLLDPVDGWVMADLGCRLAISQDLALAVEITNLFDTEAETFGVLGDARDVLGESFDNPRFLSPSAPRAVRLRLSYSF